MDGGARSIQTKHAQCQAKQSNANVQHRQRDLARRCEPLAIVQVEPVDTTETVAEPTSKESADQTVQVAEDRNGLSDDPSDNPAGNAEAEPETNRAPVALVHQARLGGKAEVNILQTNVTVHHTGTDNGRDGDAVGNLAHQRAGRCQGWRLHLGPDVEVDDHGGRQVERNLEALEHEQRLLEVLGRLHLSDQTEEGDVGAVGEDDVRDGLEGSVQGGVDGGLYDTTGVLLDADGDHGDHDSAEDTEERSERDPSHALHRPGDRQHKREDHADHTEYNRAGTVLSDSVHHNAEGENVAAHDKDAEQELAEAKEFTTKAAEQDLAGICQVLDVGVAFAH